MYLYIVISNKSGSEQNIRPNTKVYTELCYYMENSILVAMATTSDDERMSRHTVSTVCTMYQKKNVKVENFGSKSADRNGWKTASWLPWQPL